MSKFNRSNFYNKQIVNGKLENDLIDNYWNYFIIKRPLKQYAISKLFIQRPDLLSLKLYGTMKYWWILAKFNNIDDWWNDIEVGDSIQVPDKSDIDDWYLDVRRQKNNREI